MAAQPFAVTFVFKVELLPIDVFLLSQDFQLEDHDPMTTQFSSKFRTVVLSAIIAFGAASLLGACNTIEGMGKDIKSGGKAVEEAAK